jgi:response regulator RpfG family c-di-GMP phosphodiesterase
MDSIKKTDRDVVLYVDDEEFNLMLFHEYMKTEYTVLTALNTEEAYRLLKQHPVKILIADQRMPEESGLEFLARITPEFSDLIKIIFTAYNDIDTALKAINQGGIYRYILKPWNAQEIKQILKNAVSEYDLRFENKELIESKIVIILL